MTDHGILWGYNNDTMLKFTIFFLIFIYLPVAWIFSGNTNRIMNPMDRNRNHRGIDDHVCRAWAEGDPLMMVVGIYRCLGLARQFSM